MQTAQEITSNLNNLKYYSEKIASLVKTQFEEDYKRGQELGINTGPGSIRFDCMGAIKAACSLIDCYAENIAKNLETAIQQDKLLYSEESVVIQPLPQLENHTKEVDEAQEELL